MDRPKSSDKKKYGFYDDMDVPDNTYGKSHSSKTKGNSPIFFADDTTLRNEEEKETTNNIDIVRHSNEL